MSESEPKLVDPTFLTFLKAAHPAVADTVERGAKFFTELIGYGWTVEELIAAGKTGYDYVAHSSAGRSLLFGGKAYSDASAFHAWTEHHYRQLKADETGLPLREFVSLWCELSDEFHFGSNRQDCSYEALQVCIMSLRAKLPIDEARGLVRHVFYPIVSCDLYIALRTRDIDQELAFNIAAEPVGMEDLKSIMESYRRGATGDEILAAAADRRVHELALRYRKAARHRETS